MSDNNNDSGFIFGLFMGTIAGAIAGAILSPKSGEELRSFAKDYSKEWKEKIIDISDLAKEKVSKASEARKNTTKKMRDDNFDDLDLDDIDL